MKLYMREIGTEDIKGTVTVSDDYLTALIGNLKKKMSKYALGFFPNVVDNGINISIYESGEECCNVTIPRTELIGNMDKDTDKVFNDYLKADGYVGLYIRRHENESLNAVTNKILKKESINMVRKLHLKESTESNDVMELIKGIPEKDIDHYETDLYLRKTPQTTAVISKLPDVYKKNVTTFIDNIDHVPWYEIPFVFPKERNRKGVKESADDEDYVNKQSNVTESLTEDYKDSDAYKKLADYDYICDVNGNKVTIKWADDGHTYAEFTLYSPEEMFTDTDIDPYDDFGKSHGFDCWVIYNGDEYIDTYAKTYDDAVVSAIKYFWTYY